ncbi:MAG TPA: hypothetical protein VNJ51_13795 [Candidatus Dormibacteraeota bacterium]|nr:hypothetical protein [Candidatus Dormibacteraeota bacterium]
MRENRLRRMAQRQGMQLQKSRRRDPLAQDYGEIYIVNERGTKMATFASLDRAEAWLAYPERRR